MPPKSEKEALILIINIGVTSRNAESNPSLVEKMKNIAKRSIEKKIFLRPKDEVALILMGSDITKNYLNTEHVREFTDFQVGNWDLIKEMMALEATRYCSNWVEALEVAIKYMKENAFVGSTSVKKIILMSDFNEEADIISQFQADTIADKLSAENIKFISIGEATLDKRPETSLKISEVLLQNVHKKINGQHITFDDAISSLKFYIEVSTKPYPCKFDLELLDKKIPIASFVKIRKEKFPPWQKAKDNQKLQTKTEYLDAERTSYTKEEIIKGYKYGKSFLPAGEDIEKDMSYKSGPKSYKIYSFTDRNNVDLDYLYKDAAHILLPSNHVTKPFYSLVQALHETNSVAIVRKVVRDNSVPRMVVLFPCIDVPDEPWCLVEIALAFAEDRRIMETRPMKSIVKQLSNEQNEAVDNLIDSLILPDTEDSFQPGFVPSPVIQHRWHVLAYRAINPNKPLPPMENYLKEILECPSVKERSKCHLQKIAELFRLKSIDPKMKEKSEIIEEDNMQSEDDIIDAIDSYATDTGTDVDYDELIAQI